MSGSGTEHVPRTPVGGPLLFRSRGLSGVHRQPNRARHMAFVARSGEGGRGVGTCVVVSPPLPSGAPDISLLCRSGRGCSPVGCGRARAAPYCRLGGGVSLCVSSPPFFVVFPETPLPIIIGFLFLGISAVSVCCRWGGVDPSVKVSPPPPVGSLWDFSWVASTGRHRWRPCLRFIFVSHLSPFCAVPAAGLGGCHPPRCLLVSVGHI